MDQMSTLVVGTDLSEHSLSAVSCALSLIESSKGKVTVVHAIPKPWLSELQRLISPSSKSFTSEAIEKQTRELNSQISTLIRGRDINVITRLRLGDPASEIAQQAAEDRADLVIMGSQGKGKIGHLLLGSTAVGVVHKSTCPVLVIKNPKAMLYQRVLLALDLSDVSLEVIKTAKAMLPDAHFVLAHALQSPFENLSDLGLIDPGNLEQCRRSAVQDALARLEALAVQSGLAQGSYDTKLLVEGTASALVDYAHEASVDLIASAKHDKSAIRDRLLGSFTHAILSEFRGDILVVPPVRSHDSQN